MQTPPYFLQNPTARSSQLSLTLTSFPTRQLTLNKFPACSAGISDTARYPLSHQAALEVSFQTAYPVSGTYKTLKKVIMIEQRLGHQSKLLKTKKNQNFLFSEWSGSGWKFAGVLLVVLFVCLYFLLLLSLECVPCKEASTSLFLFRKIPHRL